MIETENEGVPEADDDEEDHTFVPSDQISDQIIQKQNWSVTVLRSLTEKQLLQCNSHIAMTTRQ